MDNSIDNSMNNSMDNSMDSNMDSSMDSRCTAGINSLMATTPRHAICYASISIHLVSTTDCSWLCSPSAKATTATSEHGCTACFCVEVCARS